MTEVQPKETAGEVIEMEPVNAPAPITPMQMLATAVERGTDMEQLTKLMDLQERWEANEARKAFVAAKAAFKAEAPKLEKNKHVGFESKKTGGVTDYDHATLDSIAEAVSPVLSKHGLSYSWETEQLENAAISVTCILTHVLGHSERVVLKGMPDQSGNKNSIQAVGSTCTYLSRYTLLLALGMATADMGTDGAGPVEFISAEQKGELTGLMAGFADVEGDTERFLKYLAVPTLDELPAKGFKDALAALKKKLARQEKS